MSKYTINVQNASGVQAPIAIYQVLPDTDGYSLTWLTKTINDTVSDHFDWEIDWAVGWATTEQPLAAGIQWSATSETEDMDPDNKVGNNSMGITYNNGGFQTSPLAGNDPAVPLGSIQVTLDASFSAKQAATLSVAVFMNSKPAFAMQARANGTLTFHTHPTYYICVTDNEQGVAVDGTFIGQATKIVFADGISTLSYVLDSENVFQPQ